MNIDVREVKRKLKTLGRAQGQTIREGELDRDLVMKATRLKGEIDVLQAKLKALTEEYETHRKVILDSLPGGDEDTVEILIDGILVKKHPRNMGKLNPERLMDLARQRKILTKITRQVRVIDEDAVLRTLAEGVLTYEDYESCIEKKIIPVLTLERKLDPNEVDEEQPSAV